MTPTVRPWLVVVVATLLSAAGCSNGAAVPVSEGVVTLAGSPLSNVVLDLVPDDDGELPINGAVSDDAGWFRLRSRGRGRYTVVVTDGEPGSRGARVPNRYTDPRTSPLKVVLPLAAPMALTLERE